MSSAARLSSAPIQGRAGAANGPLAVEERRRRHRDVTDAPSMKSLKPGAVTSGDRL